MSYYCINENCDGNTKVMQTSGIYRRRKCLKCDKLFLTEEIEYSLAPSELNPFTIANKKDA